MNHSHQFVEEFDGILAFGLDRKTDEDTVTCYLQKFSDDELMKALVPRVSDDELEEVFLLLTRLMKTHFTELEYHQYFLKN